MSLFINPISLELTSSNSPQLFDFLQGCIAIFHAKPDDVLPERHEGDSAKFNFDCHDLPCSLCFCATRRIPAICGFQASHSVKTVHAESRRWRVRSFLAKHKKNYVSIESNSVKLNSYCVLIHRLAFFCLENTVLFVPPCIKLIV